MIRKQNFQRNCREPCLYTSKEGSNTVILVIYVDDILIVAKDESLIDSVKTILQKEFEVKDLGYPENFVGLQITKDENDCKTISQSQFTEKTL